MDWVLTKLGFMIFGCTIAQCPVDPSFKYASACSNACRNQRLQRLLTSIGIGIVPANSHYVIDRRMVLISAQQCSCSLFFWTSEWGRIFRFHFSLWTSCINSEHCQFELWIRWWRKECTECRTHGFNYQAQFINDNHFWNTKEMVYNLSRNLRRRSNFGSRGTMYIGTSGCSW